MQLLSIVILFVAIAFAAAKPRSPQETMENAKTIARACLTKVKATEADLEDFLKHAENLSAEGKCLEACVMQEMGTMTADGDFLYDGFVKMAEESVDDAEIKTKGLGMVKQCIGAAEGSDPCEKANSVDLCMRKSLTAIGIMFHK